MTGELINWEQIHTDWNEHWRNRPDDYPLNEWFDKFWDDRGGRDAHFRKEGYRTYQRKYKEN